MPATHARRPVGRRTAALLLSVATATATLPVTALAGPAPAAPSARVAAAPSGRVAAAAPPARAAAGRPGAHQAGPDPDTGLDPHTARRQQWQLDSLEAPAAWRHATGAGVTVAVIDSGVDAGHPDLAGAVLPGVDLVDPGRDGRYDAVGHGTTVAGLIAGRDDGDGAVGLAPGARILPVRVLDASNRYDDAGVVADGIRWAVDHGASVINISLGGAGGGEVLGEALRHAFRNDVVVVACTGNLGPGAPSDVWLPARFPGVVAVAGLTREPTRSWRAGVTGPATALSAPATSLVGARPGGYWTVQGTSFATPLVAAAAALVRSRWPDMPADQVIARLLGTARDLGPHGRDPAYGFGAVDPLAALTRPVPQVAENPLVMAAAATTVDAHLAGTQRGGAGTDPADGAIGGRPDGRLPLVLLVAAALAGLLLWAVRPRPRRARPR